MIPPAAPGDDEPIPPGHRVGRMRRLGDKRAGRQRPGGTEQCHLAGAPIRRKDLEGVAQFRGACDSKFSGRRGSCGRRPAYRPTRGSLRSVRRCVRQVLGRRGEGVSVTGLDGRHDLDYFGPHSNRLQLSYTILLDKNIQLAHMPRQNDSSRRVKRKVKRKIAFRREDRVLLIFWNRQRINRSSAPMHHRWLNIAILVLWLATMSWLVKEKVLPPL